METFTVAFTKTFPKISIEGGGMKTIKDIARISGYSIGTVSRVINNRADVSEKARKKIKAVIRENDYQPNTNARMLKQNMSSDVCIIVRGNKNIFLESILEEIQIRMREHGESINVQFIGETDNEVDAAIQLGQNLKPKGIIFMGGNAHTFKDDFFKITVPCVLVTVDAEELGYDNLSSFTTDDEEAAGYAVSKLIEKGHRRIGILGGYPENLNYESKGGNIALRIKGAVEELEKNGIRFDFDKDYEPCAFSSESGYEAARKLLLKSPDLTGIFAISDVIAIGAMRVFKDMDLSVPEDVSVVGFDGVNLAEYSIPRLATIRQDAETLARKIVDDLLLRISYNSPAVHEKIPYAYVDGESIAPPRK